MRRSNSLYASLARKLLQGRLGCPRPPRPGIAKPQGRQDMQRCWLRTAINHADLDEEVLRSLLGIFHENIEVAIFVEDARIQKLVLHVVAITPFVRFDRSL